MRTGVVVGVAALLASCGGGASFDREAVVENLGGENVSGAFLDAAAEQCEGDDDRVYALTVALMIDDGNTDGVAAQAYGCDERYRDVAVENGWPLP